MSKYKKLSHIIYKCDYHIVWGPKYRLRILKGAVKGLVERDIRLLCEWKSCEVEELNVQEDHIHIFQFHQKLVFSSITKVSSSTHFPFIQFLFISRKELHYKSLGNNPPF
nr:hypothetical protein BACY1_00200 [Tenacibaculum mesophilum]